MPHRGSWDIRVPSLRPKMMDLVFLGVGPDGRQGLRAQVREVAGTFGLMADGVMAQGGGRNVIGETDQQADDRFADGAQEEKSGAQDHDHR